MNRYFLFIGICHFLFLFPIYSKQSSPQIITIKSLLSSLIGRSVNVNSDNSKNGRGYKWNEFIEEQNQKSTSRSQPLSSIVTELKSSNKSNGFNQSFIDETKDPDSPFYISMISSNIGAGNRYYNSNRSSLNDSTLKNGLDKDQAGFITKLFNYAFSTASPPPRAMLTTKRPLITYINVSNLEEHDSDESNKSQSETIAFSLFNSADPSATLLQTATKKRLPECATQQVCSAHYVRSNHTQRLCDCSRDSNWNCEDTDSIEEHTIDLSRKQEYKTQRNSLEVYTQVKLCENLNNMKPCKTPTDWTIMALQSERTGKAHFVVVCKCPDSASFEGPFTHKHPPYARFPGIRVYGMLCNQGMRKSKRDSKALEIDLEKVGNDYPEFPWELAYAVINSTATQGFW